MYGFYLISFDWMKRWRSFINNKEDSPGHIDNLELKRKILHKRKLYGNVESDTELGL